ncbi:MAG: DUF1990 domain-containing protein [Jatrophihabitans sp.]
MTFELLDQVNAVTLRQAAFTYPDVGATATAPPPGYHYVARTRTLPATRTFEAAAEDLMTWRVQRSAGLRVAASSATVKVDAVTLMRLGIGPVAVKIPCRVVYVIDEHDCQGFAYGTLPGHPESGEEAFVLQRRADGRTDFTVSAFSRPGTLLARLGGSAARGFQHLITGRYLRSLDA